MTEYINKDPIYSQAQSVTEELTLYKPDKANIHKTITCSCPVDVKKGY